MASASYVITAHPDGDVINKVTEEGVHIPLTLAETLRELRGMQGTSNFYAEEVASLQRRLERADILIKNARVVNESVSEHNEELVARLEELGAKGKGKKAQAIKELDARVTELEKYLGFTKI